MIKYIQHIILLSGMFMTVFWGYAQNWEFVKEKDGIKIFTRKENGENLKSFRGEAVFNTSIEKISSKLGTKNNFDWWDEDLRDVKIIDIEEDKFISYYLMYPVPWPLSNRDLCAKASITIDRQNKRKIVHAKPIPTALPERKGCIRIQNFYQKWDVQAIDDHHVKVILEGFIDPAGVVPAWIYNMVITDTPLKVMRALRSHVE